MKRTATNRPSMLTRQRGLGIISAIFLITVVAGLTVAITRMVTTSAEEHAASIMSMRAFLAAESGAQIGVNRLFPPLGAQSCTARTVDLSSVNLNNCEAIVQCRSETVFGRPYFTIESTGRCLDSGSVAAQRIVRVRAAG